METVWAAVGALSTLGAAVVAVVTLLALKQDSRDRTRPVIVVRFAHAILTNDYELHVVNAGASVARNLRIDFDPPLPVLEGDIHTNAERMEVWTLQRRYADPIPVVAPGEVLDNLWPEDEIEQCTVTATYADDRERSYRDVYPLLLAPMRLKTGSYPSTRGEDGERRRMVKAIETIARGIGRP